MELISYEDFKQHESKSVYAVIYSSILNNGILPLAEELSSKEIDNLTDIFNNDNIKPVKFTLVKTSNILPSNNLFMKYMLQPIDNNWNNPDIPYIFYRECKGNPLVFAIIYNVEDKTLKYSVPYGNNRNIHIFTALLLSVIVYKSNNIIICSSSPIYRSTSCTSAENNYIFHIKSFIILRYFNIYKG